MNSFTNPSTALFAYNLIDLQELCRICGTLSSDLNSMFDDNGSAYDFSSKINEYLPITVQKSDYLPQKICSMCATTLLSFHQLYIVCQSTNARFMQTLECDTHDQQVAKNNVGGDEFLELQSSFSHEIENEILHMHQSKEINETESEIAANAAVKELERISSAENISLVGVAIDRCLDVDAAVSVVSDAIRLPVEDKSILTDKSYQNQRSCGEVVKGRWTKKDPVKNQRNGENKLKNKGNAVKLPNGVRTKSAKENVGHAKVNVEKETTAATCHKSDKMEEDSTEKKEINPMQCEYCPSMFALKPLLIDHIKDAHNELIFHCEQCDNYVARVELISHMMNHALNANCGSSTLHTETQPVDSSKFNEKSMFESSSALPNDSINKSAQPKENTSPSSPSQQLITATATTSTTTATTTNGSKENQQPKNRSMHHCSDCDKCFADSSGLRYHINHFHKKIKQYECDICGTHFSCKRVITNHIRGVHMKERIFECDQCVKKFSTDSALYMHKKTHENVFKCVCQVCDRKFRSMSKLKIHMTMHTKEKNFFCEICQRGFAVRNNLTKHSLTHSKAFDFKCGKCSYVANQRRYLAEHVKRSHKID